MHITESPFKELVKTVKQNIQEIDIDIVKEKIDHNAAFLLIDVREKSEWDAGHLPSAIHLSKGIIERDINEVANTFDTSIVLYCGGGSRSALAADNLEKMGYTQVASMRGGFRGWKAVDYPLKT